ncbi:hypothetical protein HY412_02435 [Candidatus Kaiserbacteria bacterium]|nr:hypothetical protein [Candidatus Kaiserbacteria bacterium]
MKKFTCREMGGPCDMEFEGETMHEVAGMGGKHIMGTTDETHKTVRDMMANSKKEDQEKWFAWFKGLWDAK